MLIIGVTIIRASSKLLLWTQKLGSAANDDWLTAEKLSSFTKTSSSAMQPCG